MAQLVYQKMLNHQHIGREPVNDTLSGQLSAISGQLSAISFQRSAFSFQRSAFSQELIATVLLA
jgi:hypothetical protein